MVKVVGNLKELIGQAAVEYISLNEASFKSTVPGPQGAVGPIGPQGVSIHHLKGTNTTQDEGNFGVAGETDTYTFYGDADETLNLGMFSVTNGASLADIPTFEDVFTRTETTTAINNAILALVDTAPAALDTLNELAAALGDDPNFATTVTNSIASKVTKNADIVAGTGTKITYDVKGLVTGSTSLAAGDIPSLDWSKIATGKPTTISGYGITDAYTKTEVQTVLPKVGFDTTNVTAPSVGQMAWNIDENTVDLGLNGATVQIGQEQLIRVRNNTASTITNGKVVMATGTIGASGRITVAPANLTQANPKYLLGVVTEDIAAGADGFCTVFGKVRNIQTNGANYGETWVDGDVLYVKDSGSGALTNIVPTSTQVKLPVAIVINSHAITGTLFVRAVPVDENHANADLLLKADKTYVDGLIGDINSALDTINGVVI